MRLSYLIGEPGVGKSSAMAHLTRPWVDVPDRSKGLAWTEWRDPDSGALAAVELGARRDTFSGTDALGMGALPVAIEWIATQPAEFVLGEGDRLAHPRFWQAADAAGYGVTVVAMVDPRGADERRRRRAAAVGKAQAESFVKGRRSRVARLIAETDGIRVVDVGGMTADEAGAAVALALLGM